MALLFKKLALITTILTLCLVVLGAYVRLSDAGLGCPDWPGCYGTLTVPQSESAIAQAQHAYPNKPLDAPRAWKEMLHRYLAGFVGLLILALAIIGYKKASHIKVSPWLPSTLVLVVGFQAFLGMLTVTLLLKPAVVTSHLIGGMTTFAILVWITHRHWVKLPQIGLQSLKPLHYWFIRGALLILFAQIILGGWTSTNYAALACTDFPTCHGLWLPAMNHASGFQLFRELGQGANGEPLTLEALTAIQWTHRVGAIAVTVYMALLSIYLFKFKPLKIYAISLMTILAVQIFIGIGNLVLYLPLLLAVAHNLGAALLVMMMVMINSVITPLTTTNIESA